MYACIIDFVDLNDEQACDDDDVSVHVSHSQIANEHHLGRLLHSAALANPACYLQPVNEAESELCEKEYSRSDWKRVGFDKMNLTYPCGR